MKNSIAKKYYNDCHIKSLWIDNFKGFQDFSIKFSSLTVVIGDNAVGKSSLLQVIAFLKYCCTASVEEYLKDRGVTVDDLGSKGLAKIKRIMSFRTVFGFPQSEVIWELTFTIDKTNNIISLRTESVVEKSNDRETVWLEYNMNGGSRLKRGQDVREPIGKGMYPGSLLKFIDERGAKDDYPVLIGIKNFFKESELLDLLAPQHMRKTVRGKERTLGMSGEKLPALIQQLSAGEKVGLLRDIKGTLPNLHEIRSVTGRAGWTHLETEEKYKNRQINIQASGISDGTLRLMALFSLNFLQKRGGITLLDEIEDGINSANIKSCLEFLRRYCEENNQQVLLTTHSTVVLDYVEPDEIYYLYHDESGFTCCKAFTELENVHEKLQFLYPGEIILNTSSAELLGMIDVSANEPDVEGE